MSVGRCTQSRAPGEGWHSRPPTAAASSSGLQMTKHTLPSGLPKTGLAAALDCLPPSGAAPPTAS